MKHKMPMHSMPECQCIQNAVAVPQSRRRKSISVTDGCRRSSTSVIQCSHTRAKCERSVTFACPVSPFCTFVPSVSQRSLWDTSDTNVHNGNAREMHKNAEAEPSIKVA